MRVKVPDRKNIEIVDGLCSADLRSELIVVRRTVDVVQDAVLS